MSFLHSLFVTLFVLWSDRIFSTFILSAVYLNTDFAITLYLYEYSLILVLQYQYGKVLQFSLENILEPRRNHMQNSPPLFFLLLFLLVNLNQLVCLPLPGSSSEFPCISTSLSSSSRNCFCFWRDELDGEGLIDVRL